MIIWKYGIRQNGMGRWHWDVRNEMNRVETGWSTFEEREAKAMVKYMLNWSTLSGERSEMKWNGKIRDECEWGILEEAHLQ